MIKIKKNPEYLSEKEQWGQSLSGVRSLLSTVVLHYFIGMIFINYFTNITLGYVEDTYALDILEKLKYCVYYMYFLILTSVYLIFRIHRLCIKIKK